MISHANSPPKRAILLFVHTPQYEARVKPIAGTSFGERAALYLELTTHMLHTAAATNYPVLLATDNVTHRFNAKAPVHIFSQHGANFNERLTNALREAFDCGYDEVAVIGNDCADLTTNDLESAFALLQQHDIALGSAADGGVYLIAARRSALHDLTAAFAQCRWHTAHVRDDLLAQTALRGLDAALMASHADIDDTTGVLCAAAVHRELRILTIIARRLADLLVSQNFPPFLPLPVSPRFTPLLYQRPPPACAD